MVKFQIINWSDSHDKQNKEDTHKKFTIKVFGRTAKPENKKIYVRIDGFTPYFFVKIPLKWNEYNVGLFVQEIKNRVNFKSRDKLHDYTIVHKKDFYGFNAGKKFKFVRFEFTDLFTFRDYEKVFRNKISLKSIHKMYQPDDRKYPLYESNLDQMLRCMHIRDLKASGWVEIDDEKLKDLEEKESSTCDENYSVQWSDLRPCDDDSIAKFVIAAFDIECESADGSFPQANRLKDRIIQICTTFSYYGEDECFYKHAITLKSCDPIDGVDVESYETEAEVLLAWVKMIERTDPDILTGYNIFGFDEKYMVERSQLLECNEDFMKLSRLNNFTATLKEKKLASSALGENILYYFDMVGRVQIDLMKLVQREYKLNCYKLDYVVAYFISEKIKSINILDKPKRFSEERAKKEASIRKIENNIKKIKEDLEENIKKEVKNEIEKQTEKLNVDVQAVKEKEYVIKDKTRYNEINILLEKYFTKINKLDKKKNKEEISKLDEKIVALVNERCKISKTKLPEIKLKKIKNDKKLTDEETKKIAENLAIKITKVSKKLIKEKEEELVKLNKEIQKIPKCESDIKYNIEIRTDSTKGLYVDNYISLSYFDGIADYLYGDGKKMKVKAITEDTIYCDDDGKCIADLIEIVDKKYKIKWSQAKDDVTPADIFRLQKGSSADRAVIAKYCLQDCALCSRLINKLSVLTNNIGMSNVCAIPLTYLFTRGQSIKSVSLVSKETRKSGYLIPTLPKYKPLLDEKGNEIKGVGYQGACVFTPKPGVYLNPIAVLDYSSLYPKSMAMRNLSHEMFVTDSKYANLKNYFYYDITVENNDGTIEKCKFARHISGKLGLIPKVLMFLLDAREVYKEKCKVETDPFKKKIYDALQLAYKITANSLYGCIGSPTSQIYLRQIAASTTKTGKHMLEFAAKTITDNFKGAEVIYGDSVLGNSPILLQDENGKSIIKEIKELCEEDEWKEYKNFKDESCNKYFEGILKKLFKNNNSILKIKSENRDNDIKISNFINNKPMGMISDRLNRYEVMFTCKKKGLKKISKTFTKSVFGTQKAYDLACKYYIQMNKTYKLFKNNYKKMYDVNNNCEYYEVMLTQNKLMLCDVDDFDIIQKYIWNSSENSTGNNFYARSWDPKNKCTISFHKLVIKKILNKLPEKIRKKLDNKKITPDHINNNTLDNRKQNLRLATLTEQMYNQKKSIRDTVGIYKNKNKLGTWKVQYSFNKKTHVKSFPTKEEAINFRKQKMNEIKNELENEKQTLISDLMSIIKEDQFDRTNKEKSTTLFKAYTSNGWQPIKKVIRHKTNKKIYRIYTQDSIIEVTEDHSLIDENNKVIFPHECKLGTKLLHGVDQSKLNLSQKLINKHKNNKVFISNNKKECMEFAMVQKQFGNNTLISYENGEYQLVSITNKNKFNEIIKIEELPAIEQYVYDLETQNHEFQAGIGQIVAHNTDSVFIAFNTKDKDNKLDISKEALAQSIKLAQQAAKLINDSIPKPQSIIYEKTFFPFCIISKKRYVGNKYETDLNKYTSASMGIVLKRRDNANIVKCIVGGVIDKIMNQRDIKAAVAFVKKELINILNNKYLMDKFIITKTLKSSYKNPLSIAHKVLADRMSEREAGTAPQCGDRIPFVYKRIDKNGVEPKNILQGVRAEHPDYMKKNNLKIDHLFYITNQIQVPTVQFLELLMDKPERIFEKAVNKELNRRRHTKEIDKFFKSTKIKKDDNNYEDKEEPFSLNLKGDYAHMFELDNTKRKKTNIVRKSKKPKSVIQFLQT
jgi:DNA polymerase elongation subunit (family B)